MGAHFLQVSAAALTCNHRGAHLQFGLSVAPFCHQPTALVSPQGATSHQPGRLMTQKAPVDDSEKGLTFETLGPLVASAFL